MPIIDPKKESKTPSKKQLHEESDTELQDQLKAVLLAKFATPQKAFFDACNREGCVTRREWKRVLRKAMPDMTQKDAKQVQIV